LCQVSGAARPGRWASGSGTTSSINSPPSRPTSNCLIKVERLAFAATSAESSPRSSRPRSTRHRPIGGVGSWLADVAFTCRRFPVFAMRVSIRTSRRPNAAGRSESGAVSGAPPQFRRRLGQLGVGPHQCGVRTLENACLGRPTTRLPASLQPLPDPPNAARDPCQSFGIGIDGLVGETIFAHRGQPLARSGVQARRIRRRNRAAALRPARYAHRSSRRPFITACTISARRAGAGNLTR
jgi:hypothetical protein